MNEYIINPMWFYWVKVLDSINGIAIGGMVLGLVTSVLFFAFANDSYDDKEEGMWKKNMKIAIAMTVISVAVVVFVPSGDTLIKMKLAEFVTHDNVTSVIDTIKDMADKIIGEMR